MNYPIELRRRELAALRRRRQVARPTADGDGSAPAAGDPAASQMPDDTIGLALSGGGIRSATVCLGVLQELARKDRLRQIDFMSTVSGGGYAGSFLGRLFTRAVVREQADPCGRAQEILADSRSPEISWLRAHANYIFSETTDVAQSLGVFWRNLASIYLIFFFFGLAAFGVLKLGGESLVKIIPALQPSGMGTLLDPALLTPWWHLPGLILVLAVIPCALAYWLAPGTRSRASFNLVSMAGWVFLLAIAGLSLTLAAVPPQVVFVGVVILLATIVWLEGARCDMPQRPDSSSGLSPMADGAVIRNRLTRALGETLILFGGSCLWVLLDTLARYFAAGKLVTLMSAWAALAAPAGMFLKRLADWLGKQDSRTDKGSAWSIPASLKAAAIAAILAGFLLVLLDGCVHWFYARNSAWGCLSLGVGLAMSYVFRQSFQFLNYSSLLQAYAARLSRTFLGATNPARLRSEPGEGGSDITISHTNDDIPFEEYHPERYGGPLHLLGVCVNETREAESQRESPDSFGLPMCVGPCGASVGRRFHALWCEAAQRSTWKEKLRLILDRHPPAAGHTSALCAIVRAGDLFHVLVGKTGGPVSSEPLSLGRWAAISGAAFGTGKGRGTSSATAFLFGLANLRLGYWWDSGLKYSERPGKYAANLWRLLERLPQTVFPMQTMLLSEFLGRFAGPSERFWNLSDGGHFDNTGLYELLRRRVPLIIAVGADCDPYYHFEDLASLTRQARVDFGAQLEFVDDPAGVLAQVGGPVPAAFASWFNPQAFGPVAGIGPNGKSHATLAKVTYGCDPSQVSWIVLLKSSLTGDESMDVLAYQKSNTQFPNEPTTDQFFNGSQWESYRQLGQHMAQIALR